MSKFKVGDVVVLQKLNEDWSNFTNSMRLAVGKYGVVDRMEHNGRHGEQLGVTFGNYPDDDFWWIQPDCVKLVSKEVSGEVASSVKESPAITFLEKASSLMRERGQQYDKPQGERSMGVTINAFNIITGRDLKESEGWLLMQLLKDVRQWQNPDKYHADSAEDCIAYAALKAEALAEGK